MPEHLLTLTQLADALGWRPDKVRRLVAKGVMPVTRIEGRLYFRPSVIDAWIAMQSVAPATLPSAADHVTADRVDECARLGIAAEHEFS